MTSISTSDAVGRLITIPVSHYCEKIRWALERLEITFIEEPHMPPFHQFATKGGSVPVLTIGNRLLTDSSDILDYLDELAPAELKLYPIDRDRRTEVEKLVNSFDNILAPAVRQWAYSYIMARADLLHPLWCQGVPWYERMLFPILFPSLRSKVVEMYDLGAQSTISAHKSICEIFETVDLLLADGRAYLTGDRFSAADLTFAAFAAPILLPPEYGIKLPLLEQMPSAMMASISAFQQTTAGKFGLRLYQEHRTVTPILPTTE
jgi:glutathione S-transferase